MALPIRRTSCRLEAMESLRLPAALTDDLLREIFLRVASPADLARVAASCVSFCLLITDPSLLRRYHFLHPPLLLGFIDSDGLHPVPAPLPNAAASRNFARTVDFSPSTSPSATSLATAVWSMSASAVSSSSSLLATSPHTMGPHCLQPCDPAIPTGASHTRRLLASAQIQTRNIINIQTFLASSEDDEETSFSDALHS
ncbi:hypothetical protein PR202_gb21174 [Eleusine coracana subsp. coracana]|uniref:F-box domain-containing protein n=1 Tax=Eleusine coracana subsp. coracana TaxID=191504 RepID=A0AAV5FEH6_ELECO|nr:hypothetical protein PR202_gb21174 [Eleusine coracana subsp. coracana]